MTNESGSGENWEKAFQRYVDEGDAQKKNAYMIGLANSPNVTQLQMWVVRVDFKAWEF
jgi:hypothetical protein